jgi:hypothetical protein
MASLTVRISPGAHKLLGELAKTSGESMQAVLDKALEAYRLKCFLEGLAADFAALRADPAAWKEELQERALWEGTLMDDLEEDRPTPAGPRSPRKQKKR